MHEVSLFYMTYEYSTSGRWRDFHRLQNSGSPAARHALEAKGSTIYDVSRIDPPKVCLTTQSLPVYVSKVLPP